MDIEAIRLYCLSKRGVSESFPFDEYALVFKVMDKMFALLDLETGQSLSLKCEPSWSLELREQYEGIAPAYHFNKKHWNGVALGSDVPDDLLRRLIDHSYEEVVKKLNRTSRLQYEAL